MNLQNPSLSRRALAIACLVAAILQVALAPQIEILGGRINFMLVLVAVLSLAVESRTLVIIGFIAGLFYDFTAAVPVGLMTLLLSLAAYVAATVFSGAVGASLADRARAAGLVIFAVNLVNGLVLFFLGASGNLLYALGVHALASTVLDVLVSLPALALLARSMEAPSGFTVGRSRLGAHPRQRRSASRFKGLR